MLSLMKRKMWILGAVLAALSMFLFGCGEQEAKKDTADTVIADGLANINVEGETDLPGNFFLSFVYSRNLIMLDGKGQIVWSKHEEQPTKDVTTGWWDFKKHDVNGTTYYSYHDQNYQMDNYGLLGYAPGERVIMDEHFNEVKRITMEASDVTAKGQGADGHDFLMIDPDHYILSCYVKENVKNVPGYPDGSDVIYSYLQEVKNGEVIWDWKSIDYPELYDLIMTEATPTADDFSNEQVDAPDIVHFNAMRLDNDGNLVCSFRHLDTILCLDRSKEKDQIKWKLSGKGDEFGLTELQKTSGQHYLTVDGNEYTVFDNNNRDAQTEIRTYVLDMKKKTVELVKSFGFKNKFSQACGSVQKLDDNLYVIGWGWATTDAECMSVYDFSTGEELLKVTLEDPKNITYRCVYYE